MKDTITNLRYNEKKYAESILEFGFHTKYRLYELKVIAKYFKYQGIKPKQRKEKLYEFCEKNIEGFNRVLYFKTINSALNYAKSKKNNLVIIEEIPITQTEMAYINGLELDDTYKKLLFTMLVKDKLTKEVCLQLYGEASNYNSYGGKGTRFKELFEVSKISKGSKKYEISQMINVLSQHGVVDVWNKGKINMSFISSIEPSEEIVFSVTSFDDIGYYYDYFCGFNKVAKCEQCSKLYKMRSNNHKMCKFCWKDREKELTRLRVRKYREIKQNKM